MSAYLRGHSDICIVTDQTGFPAWQPGQDMTITASVGGHAALLTFDRVHACILSSISWNGKQFLKPQPANNGQNSGWSDSVLYPGEVTAWNPFTPTSAGGDNDSSDIDSLCTSNCPLKGKNATGDGAEFLQKAAFWLLGGVASAGFPTHPGQNKRELCEMLSYLKFQFGLGGNNNILVVERSVIIPTDPYIQGAQKIVTIPTYCVLPNPTGTPDFSVLEFVNLTTGATRACAGGPTSSTTECVMASNAAATFALSVVMGPNVIQGGAYFGWATSSGGGLMETYVEAEVGVAAGVWYQPTAICFGTRADVITASVAAAAGLPSGSFTAGKTTLP